MSTPYIIFTEWCSRRWRSSLGYKRFKLCSDITLVQETGVANFMRCNIWHVKGRDFDLVIDTGMGLDPLKEFILKETNKPIKALVTHSHFDHSGCLHEFPERLGHRAEAKILANPMNSKVVYEGAWTKIAIVDLTQHPDYSAQTFSITPAPLTHYVDEGDVIDLGNRAFQVLHLPGHSPGSIGLFDVKNSVLFSGDAIYDGALLDSLYHSDKAIYAQTLERLTALNIDVVHAGHFPSFDKQRLLQIIRQYHEGANSLVDIEHWFAKEQQQQTDIFCDQDWSAFTATR